MKIDNINRKTIIKNRWLTLFEDIFDLPSDASCTYYHVQKLDAVMMIAIDLKDCNRATYIVNHYRHPIGQTIWQFPIGGCNTKIENPIDIARTELLEETGIQVGEISYRGSFFADPGFTNQKMHVCISTDILKQSSPRLEESEYGLISKKVAVDEIELLIASGEMGDAWSITGYYYLSSYLNDLKK